MGGYLALDIEKLQGTIHKVSPPKMVIGVRQQISLPLQIVDYVFFPISGVLAKCWLNFVNNAIFGTYTLGYMISFQISHG